MRGQLEAMYTARTLHAAIRRRTRAALDCRSRAELERDADIASLAPRVREQLFQVIGRVAGARESAVHLAKVMAGYDPRTAERMIAASGELEDREVLIALAASPGFADLEPEERLDLIGYAVGPRSGGERSAALRDAWRARREAIHDCLDQPAEVLRDFLYRPSLSIRFLQAGGAYGRKIVVVGDPALSYTRRGAKVASPDPCVASGWSLDSADCSTIYSFRAYQVSRDDERRFVETIEAQMFEAALRFAAAVAQRDGTAVRHGFMQFGEICVLEHSVREDQEIAGFIGSYLAAG